MHGRTSFSLSMAFAAVTLAAGCRESLVAWLVCLAASTALVAQALLLRSQSYSIFDARDAASFETPTAVRVLHTPARLAGSHYWRCPCWPRAAQPPDGDSDEPSTFVTVFQISVWRPRESDLALLSLASPVHVLLAGPFMGVPVATRALLWLLLSALMTLTTSLMSAAARTELALARAAHRIEHEVTRLHVPASDDDDEDGDDRVSPAAPRKWVGKRPPNQ